MSPPSSSAPGVAQRPSLAEADLLAAGRHPLVAEIDRRLERSCGVERRRPTVAGVSGGADSIALLVALVILHRRDASRGELLAVHVHHHIRGAAADDDACSVLDLGAALGVRTQVEHVDAAVDRGNLSWRARELRYEALTRIATTAGAPAVAVAHHADDQLETLLMALCRGAGPTGLAGMSWHRPLAPGICLVRPLLGARRSDCESLCRAAGLPWRDDESNTDLRYTRARLRHDVIPQLEALWPNAARRAAMTAETLGAAAQAFDREVATAFGPPEDRRWLRAGLRALSTPVICAGLRRAALAAAPAQSDAFGQRQLLPAAEMIASSETAPKVFQWAGGVRVLVNARTVELHRDRPNVRTPD